MDARLSQQDAVDEVIVVRSERLVVSDPAFAERVLGTGRARPVAAAARRRSRAIWTRAGAVGLG